MPARESGSSGNDAIEKKAICFALRLLSERFLWNNEIDNQWNAFVTLGEFKPHGKRAGGHDEGGGSGGSGASRSTAFSYVIGEYCRRY